MLYGHRNEFHRKSKKAEFFILDWLEGDVSPFWNADLIYIAVKSYEKIENI